MKWLFKNKTRAFWILQTIGWLGFGLARTFNGLAHGREPAYVYPSIVAMITGFLLTLILRSVFSTIRDRPLPHVASVAVALTVLLSLIFSTIETIGHVEFYDPYWRPRGLQFLANALLDAYVLLTWTALYFGINYYLLVQEEREKVLKATSMAHQAQLKMLRYQLNPHFLFNTLNAISTLVMDRDSKNANGMLRKLSDFLRYTLVNEPTQKVTLDQELHALQLYLDIEKVRFVERLVITEDIDDDARQALIPSLILQPLIENAIKYAIAPSEEGGLIALSAKIEKGQLILKIRDDGPGLDGETAPESVTSSGVGIPNTRERLKQIYDENHSFNLHNLESGGLEVIIIIPCEYREVPGGGKDGKNSNHIGR